MKAQCVDGDGGVLFRIGPKGSRSGISPERSNQDSVDGIDIYLAHVGVTCDEVARFTLRALDGIAKHARRILKFSMSLWSSLNFTGTHRPPRATVLKPREAHNKPPVTTHRHTT